MRASPSQQERPSAMAPQGNSPCGMRALRPLPELPEDGRICSGSFPSTVQAQVL